MDRRADVIRYLILGAGLIILGKVGSMQLFDPSYRIKAEAATIEKDEIEPSRGLIFDRHGDLLVYNQPSYNVYLTYGLLDEQMDIGSFCKILDIDQTGFNQRANKDWNDVKFSKKVPFLFYKGLSAERNARLQESLHTFPGFHTEVHNVRGYVHPNGAHFLGYLNEVDQELVNADPKNYRPGDYRGTAGLEAHYERQLRGTKGTSHKLRDNFGRNVGSYDSGYFRNASAKSGTDMVLGVDMNLQAYAEELLLGKIGAFVAIEPSSGEILAMGSSPTYDPAQLSAQGKSAVFDRLGQDSLKPFFNRATMARYPPGSLFKPILSLIALQEGVLQTHRYITCKGAYYYKIYRWGCHANPGRRNVSGAIQESCNTFFFTIYRELIDKYGFSNPEQGLEVVTNHLYDFGLGDQLGLDLPAEHKGLIPDTDFYDDLYEGRGDWRSTYIISNGIGQGEIELTLLQMANVMAIIANRGYYYPPHLVKNILSNSISIDPDYVSRKNVRIAADHFPPVIEGLEKAVYNGTAGLAAVPDLQVCGKTGTSENPHGEDHSVFMAFAPRHDPKIAVAVIVENAGWGSTFAAPIGGLMIEKFIKGSIDPRRLWIENHIKEADLLADL